MGTPIALPWPDVTAALSSSPRQPSVVTVVAGAGYWVTTTPISRSLPTTQAVGATCDAVPRMPEGYQGLGLTLPARATGVSVVRIFGRGGPLPVSTAVSIHSDSHMARVLLQQSGWPVGHYTLILTSDRGLVGYVPFCVTQANPRGAASAPSSVPATADAPSARFELWDPAQP